MKKNDYYLYIYPLSFLLLVLGVIYIATYYSRLEQRNNRLNHTGTFVIDFEKTTWGDYQNNKKQFKDFEITFNEDNTFSTNMEVDFLVDTTGTWEESEGGFEASGEISYSNSTYRSQTSEGISNGKYFVGTNGLIQREGKPKIEYLSLRKKGNNIKLYGEEVK